MDSLSFILISSFSEGLTVTVIGVTVVFLVLGILSLAIYLIGYITSRIAKRIESKEKIVAVPKVEKEEDEELAAVIASAIAAYMILRSKVVSRPIRKKRSLWDFARKVEAIMPEHSVSRLNYDELLINEGLRRSC
ncbi:MAG TPA: hypothetical protein ENK81_03225 [Euryarchaeota archaeon]|nr:hypothetical protein [Euryarchaeota archaeon]